VRKAQHKKRQIAKRDLNDDRNKRRKAGETGVSSDEAPSPEPSWCSDVASAAIDWSNMSGSSSWSPPRGAKVSSSHRRERRGMTRQWARAHVRWLLLPVWACGRPALVWASRTGTPEPHRSVPYQIDPPRRSVERSVSVRQIYDGSDRPDSDSLQRRRSRGRSLDSASTPSVAPVAELSTAPRRLQSLLI
jgi:hypothetical protein